MSAAGGAVARPRLVHGAVWGVAGYGVYAAAQWGLLVAAARLGSPELVGRYSLALSLAGPPLVLANLQLRTLAATDCEAHYAPGGLWRLRHRATLAGLALAFFAARFAGLETRAVLEILLAAAVKAVENAADLCHGALQRAEAMPAIAAAWGAKGLLGLTAFAATLAVTGRLWPALAAVAASHLAVLLCWERPQAEAAALPEREYGRSPLWAAVLPLGVVLAAIQLLAAVPRYLLEQRHGPAVLGCFAALHAFPAALQAGLGAAAMAATSRLAVLFRQDRRAYFGLTGHLAAFALSTGVLALAASSGLAALAGRLYGPAFAGQRQLLGWLLAAGALAGVTAMTGSALTAARVYAPQAWLYMTAVAAAVVYGRNAVAAGGALGAAQTLLAATVVVAVGHAVLLGGLARRPV